MQEKKKTTNERGRGENVNRKEVRGVKARREIGGMEGEERREWQKRTKYDEGKEGD